MQGSRGHAFRWPQRPAKIHVLLLLLPLVIGYEPAGLTVHPPPE